MQSTIGMFGSLVARKQSPARPGWRWYLRNYSRPGWVLGIIGMLLARALTAVTGIPTIVSNLRVRVVTRSGDVIDYGVVGRRVVTDAGVGFLVDDWADASQDITNLNYHACGTGTTAEASGDTALVAEATAITDRAAGTKTQPAANQIRTVATLSFTGAGAITEHGLFSSVTEGAGTLWDRTVFAAINVADGDSIEFTYTCTFQSGS